MALSEAYGGEWPDSPPSVWQRLAKSASEHPEKLALACLHQPANLYGRKSLTNDHLQWSYAQLSSATDSFSKGLQAHGLTSKSAIVTFLDNGVEFGLSVWAAHKLDCPFVPLNPRNLLNATEARHMLAVADVAVVIVGSSESAAAVDALAYRSERIFLKITAGDAALNGWIGFSELLPVVSEPNGEPTPTNQDSNDTMADSLLVGSPHEGDDTLVTVLFTSGTTFLPKGCPHTNRTLNAFMKNLALGGCSSDDVFCGVLPNNHAMGYFYVLHFFCEGGSVIYPSPTFQAEQMAKALKAHSCSHACLVPTALHSLIDVAEQDSLTFPTLKDVCLAGASITPRNLRQVVDTLGSQAVSTGFGMTEGSPIWTAATSNPETLISGEDTISGQPSPGTYIKVCASDSIQPLQRGQPGEVHESGPGVIAGYLGNDIGSESFYTDGGRKWFKTGDRAIMHSDGRVSIVGRYKDMIIRGGENIAPAAIEAILNRAPGVEAQVVAATDSIAGEVPVAIVRRLPLGGNASMSLQDEVRTSMGMLYVPDEIMTLQDLGLDDYPRTMSGKVQKSTLRNLVAAFRRHRGSDSSQPEKQSKSIEETVLHVWWKATGIVPGSLDKEAPTSNFADSITTMRVRDMYRKELGLTLSTREMANHESLRKQINTLQSKSNPSARKDSAYEPSGIASPPSLEDIQLVIGVENDAMSFKETASSALAKHGFSFDQDVATVVQSSDFTDVLIRTKVMDTWNFGIAVVADGSTVPALGKALVAALEQSPLWPSFYVLGDNGSPFYVTMKPQKKLYDHCLTLCGSIPTLADLQQVAIQYPHREHSTYPGLLFHARLYHVEELGSAAFVMYLHHAVHDASSMRLVLEDLNTSLREPGQPLRPHIPFETFADIYHSLRNSPRATLEVNWHVKRLADLHLHRKALYPPATVPRQATTSNPDGWDYGFDAPQLLDLKRHHPHITASVVLKAAIALVSTTRTGHTHALFGNMEACRSTLPFWPTSLGRLSSTEDGTSLADLDASDVAGPTMNAVTNLIPVHHSESGIAFLTRLQNEQSELTKHSHAPWRRIMDKLNALHPGECAGDLLPEVHQTFFMTWVPGFLGDYERVRVAQIAIRAALGMVFVAGLGGPQATTYMISLRWDAANYSQGETEKFVKDVERAVVWLLYEGNWEAPVEGFLDSCVK
jgi:acyl-CoA synthetase (AMP-forming)/AMP-acid ligase II